MFANRFREVDSVGVNSVRTQTSSNSTGRRVADRVTAKTKRYSSAQRFQQLEMPLHTQTIVDGVYS